jgi:predicted nucleic acid-binding protein
MNDADAYLDASAFVKLIVEERETTALRRYLADWPAHTSCALLRTEAIRAVNRQDPEAVTRAREGLGEIGLIALDDALLDAAGIIEPQIVRSLDAIHLAAALSLGESLGVVVTYDDRMLEAARLLGLPVASPS